MLFQYQGCYFLWFQVKLLMDNEWDLNIYIKKLSKFRVLFFQLLSLFG